MATWDDLGDDELHSRLVYHLIDAGHPSPVAQATELVRHRDDDRHAAAITEVLN